MVHDIKRILFREQLSSRKIPLEEIAVWGTNKKAVKVRDSTITTKVLNKWAEGSSLSQTIQFFEDEETNKETAKLVINKLNDHLGLWQDEYEGSIRRSPAEIAESLNKINDSLGGFNHYEHGVDIVCWLEDVYRAPATGGFGGLNLCPETIECIFKHTYDRDTEILSQTNLAKVTKHSKLINDTSCHLEGQAIRIADKISYLISDLEDGSCTHRYDTTFRNIVA